MSSTVIDFHTHRLDATAALIAVDPRQFDPQAGRCYSVGFHPWHDVDMLTADDFTLLEQCARHPQVLAIGETGLDRLRGADLEIQARAFARHLHLAHELGKPVVVHNVRATQDILAIRHREHLDDVPLAIHGMRGNRHVSLTLLAAGCYLSFGQRFNPEALIATPIDRLLIETDDSAASIDEVAASVAHVLGIKTDQVTKAAAENARRLLSI